MAGCVGLTRPCYQIGPMLPIDVLLLPSTGRSFCAMKHSASMWSGTPARMSEVSASLASSRRAADAAPAQPPSSGDDGDSGLDAMDSQRLGDSAGMAEASTKHSLSA